MVRKIWVESDSGNGATLHFVFLASGATAAAPPSWQSAQPQLTGKRLLIVEDNATNRRIIKHRAEQWGMVVEQAFSGKDALRLLTHSEPFDAAILDLQLPDMDGLALAGDIRQKT